MYRVINAAQVKKLPIGSKVYVISNERPWDMNHIYTLIQYGRKKMLQNETHMIGIKDINSQHYEVEV